MIQKKHSVRAIGIPAISEGVKGVRTNVITEQRGILKSEIRRGKGKVDLLIGIDHLYMHTGQTKQSKHLVARRSPLRWVIFGSAMGEPRSTKTTVSHVKYATPVDLSDFWTTEALE